MSDRSRHNRQIFAIATEARIISRDDRLLLAASLLGKPVESFTDLSNAEMRDLALAMQDWRLIEEARKSTGSYTVDAIEHLLNLSLPDEVQKAMSDLCESMGLTLHSTNDKKTAVEGEL